jgi:soluble lytic murein transglycosylase-like protein
MNLIARGRVEGNPRRLGIVEEMELLVRRARGLKFMLPVLLLLGLGAGHLVKRALRVPESATTRVTERSEAAGFRLVAIGSQMQRVREAGVHTAEYVRRYREEVAPVEQVLLRRGVPRQTARRVAWPLVEQSSQNGVDPATVLSVLLVESAGRPDARSSVGARGLMQIMPSWAGFWRGCGRDLYAIEDNLCNGTKILAMYLDRHDGDERRALLGYNGCVRGTNTPDCGRYPDKVATIRRQLQNEMATARRGSFRTRPSATQ